MKRGISFLLNGVPEVVHDISPTMTVLQYLRRTKRLTGTKEGCAEGDCGACTVVVGELCGDKSSDQKVRYRAVNACIQFLPMLEGKLLLTVESLRGRDGILHPVQQAMVDEHGSQCGFCTPGFVMSLHAAWLEGASLDRPGVNDLLAGNLCRCTGYGPIIDAALSMNDAERVAEEVEVRSNDFEALNALSHDGTVSLSHRDQQYFLPSTIEDLSDLLLKHPDATVVAGATDVGLWVTKQHRNLETVIDIGRVRALQAISTTESGLIIGAGVTYTDAESELERAFPDFGELTRRIGGRQVRNAGTIGGNIANGSPIGDTPPALIALGATLILRKGDNQRRLPLESYFLEYGKQDREAGEFVEAIEVPFLDNPSELRCYKISKRFDQDISALCGCFNIQINDGQVVSARIAFGGMAATPRRADHVEASLIGMPWSASTIDNALDAFKQDFAPIDDMRASADYRMRVAKNLLRRYFHESENPLSETRLVGREAAI